MKFRGHETFPIRKGWLNKGIKNIIANPSVFVSKESNPMDILGIGANMVKAMRYWLQATAQTSEPSSGKRDQKTTDIGRLIFDNDPYFEEIGSLWIVHYGLATNIELATSWYIFFNEFDAVEFTEDDFYRRVRKYVTMLDPEKIPASRTVSDDFKCIINTYFSKAKLSNSEINPEDNTSCPLTDLGLIDYVATSGGTRVYRKSMPIADNIPDMVALAMLLDFAKGKKEVKISSIQKDACGLGKICNLDTITLLNILYRLEAFDYIKVVRTAGLDVINIKTDLTYLQCIEQYYAQLNDK